jgi:hypothetical protein
VPKCFCSVFVLIGPGAPLRALTWHMQHLLHSVRMRLVFNSTTMSEPSSFGTPPLQFAINRLSSTLDPTGFFRKRKLPLSDPHSPSTPFGRRAYDDSGSPFSVHASANTSMRPDDDRLKHGGRRKKSNGRSPSPPFWILSIGDGGDAE